MCFLFFLCCVSHCVLKKNGTMCVINVSFSLFSCFSTVEFGVCVPAPRRIRHLASPLLILLFSIYYAFLIYERRRNFSRFLF